MTPVIQTGICAACGISFFLIWFNLYFTDTLKLFACSKFMSRPDGAKIVCSNFPHFAFSETLIHFPFSPLTSQLSDLMLTEVTWHFFEMTLLYDCNF